MFFEVPSLTYHSPITVKRWTCGHKLLNGSRCIGAYEAALPPPRSRRLFGVIASRSRSRCRLQPCGDSVARRNSALVDASTWDVNGRLPEPGAPHRESISRLRARSLQSNGTGASRSRPRRQRDLRQSRERPKAQAREDDRLRHVHPKPPIRTHTRHEPSIGVVPPYEHKEHE